LFDPANFFLSAGFDIHTFRRRFLVSSPSFPRKRESIFALGLEQRGFPLARE
jgi:hypothetical protein